jgi:uncharacterized protein
MKKIALVCMALIALIACRKVEKETQNTVAEDLIEVEKDTTSVKLDENSIKKSVKQLKEELAAKGFETFHYIDEKTKDTLLMQQYFMAFLKNGPIRSQNEEEATLLQKEHQAYLAKMYELGYADISGPFGDKGAIRGITIYNVPTQKMADSLANADPMVKAGRLVIEIHPWWAEKGGSLR